MNAIIAVTAVLVLAAAVFWWISQILTVSGGLTVSPTDLAGHMPTELGKPPIRALGRFARGFIRLDSTLFESPGMDTVFIRLLLTTRILGPRL